LRLCRKRGQGGDHKKSELVNSLLWYFDIARSAATPTAAQEKAPEWLPDAMRFPAVNPDAVAQAEEEPDEVPWEEAA
jgi:hypothetical protein